MSRDWINSRWFALLVLISAAASGFLWYAGIGPGVLPLITGGVPLILLYLGNRQTSISVLYTALLALFLLTAAVGVWAAYNPDAAGQKFWIILGAVMIFFAVAAQPPTNIRSIFWGLSFLGLAIAVFYFLTFQPIENPADLASIDQLKQAWAANRLILGWSAPNSNFVGGILAVLILFTMAVGHAAWRARQKAEALLVGLILAVQVFALYMTSSRAAWASLVIGIAVWMWWEISKPVSFRIKKGRALIFRGGLVISLGILIVLLVLFPTNLYALASSLPGADSASTRAGLFRQALDLVPDFWLTGGGLQSFAGLYSHYILGIPNLYFEYGHNLYLDIPIEQGILGLAALLAIYALAGISLLRGFKRLRKGSFAVRRFYPAVFAALIVLLVNGVLDDPFYGQRGTPLLFVVPGLAFLLTAALPKSNKISQPAHKGKRTSSPWKLAGSIVLIGLVGAFLVSFYPLASAVEANLGAVSMARVELQNFPSGTWQDSTQVGMLEPAREHFRQALWYNPGNRTANYRAGLLAVQEGDYSSSIYHLESARAAYASHRGITKALGYSYVWSGEFWRAYALIASIPEAQDELRSYASWWRLQDRPDLAENAAQMAAMLCVEQNP